MGVALHGLLFDWIGDGWHLHVLLFAEAEEFTVVRDVHLDGLAFLDTWEGLRALAKSATITTVTQAEILGLSLTVERGFSVVG